MFQIKAPSALGLRRLIRLRAVFNRRKLPSGFCCPVLIAAQALGGHAMQKSSARRQEAAGGG
jgi:hypothetical protein